MRRPRWETFVAGLAVVADLAGLISCSNVEAPGQVPISLRVRLLQRHLRHASAATRVRAVPFHASTGVADPAPRTGSASGRATCKIRSAGPTPSCRVVARASGGFHPSRPTSCQGPFLDGPGSDTHDRASAGYQARSREIAPALVEPRDRGQQRAREGMKCYEHNTAYVR